jgi:hypothetical protein
MGGHAPILIMIPADPAIIAGNQPDTFDHPERLQLRMFPAIADRPYLTPLD